MQYGLLLLKKVAWAMSKPRPVVIHNAIERDRRLMWHPIIELRHNGVVIYACTAVKGYMQPARAAAQGMKETRSLLGAAQ